MLIQKQYNKLILLEIQIEQEVQECIYYWRLSKETLLDFSKETVIIMILFRFMKILK